MTLNRDLELRLRKAIEITSEKASSRAPITHPDQQLLLDWATYGPKGPNIQHLVWRLALEHDLRVSDIEEFIATCLARKLQKLERERLTRAHSRPRP